jgi:hypothetical protein
MIHPRISALLESLNREAPPFPPTILYNEGWLLRLIVSWFSNQPFSNFPLAFTPNAQWFSEALLPSAFQARFRGDSLAESRTQLDGVVGHIIVGTKGRTDLCIQPKATQFIALEAKMFSSLSSGTTNMKFFDQAARNIACIAELLRRSKLPATQLAQLGFYVLAPNTQISNGVFDNQIKKDSIQQKVEQRVKVYSGSKDQWFSDWFMPTLQQIDLKAISWESIIKEIAKRDAIEGQQLEDFFDCCVRFNRPIKPANK